MTPATAQAIEAVVVEATKTESTVTQPTYIASMNSPFSCVKLPPDGITLADQKFYSITQVARHIGIGTGVLHKLCKEGKIEFIVQPGMQNGKRLIPEAAVRRLIGA
jgi:hypothetical protein